MKGSSKLLALIIHKNDSRYIYGCIDSLSGKVDKVVVGDTGSSDEEKRRTMSFCSLYGAEFVELSPFENFSKSRNELLRFCESGDWFLQIDCDERLEGGGSLKSFILDQWDENVGTLELVLCGNHRYLDGSFRWFTEVVSRVFRYEDGLEYSFDIHESLLPSLKRLGRTGLFYGGGRIVHLGYESSVEEMVGKALRNRERLLRSIETQDLPLHELGYHYYMLGQTDVWLNNFKRGLGYLGIAYSYLQDEGLRQKVSNMINSVTRMVKIRKE